MGSPEAQNIIGAAAIGVGAAFAGPGGAASAEAFLTSFFTTAVLGGASYVLNQPKKQDEQSLANQPGGNKVTRRDPAATFKILYGYTRTPGVIVHMETTGEENLLHMVIVLAGHEVDEILDIYIGDTLITDSRFAGETKNGDFSLAGGSYITIINKDPPSDLVTLSGWTGDDLTTFIEDDQTFIEIGGTAGGTHDGIYRRYTPNDSLLSATQVTLQRVDGTFADGYLENISGGTLKVCYAWVNTHLGADDQTADADLVAASADWDSNDRLRGLAYLYVRLAYSAKVFPNGLENITATVKGKKVYDPDLDVTAWSENPALCACDYLTNTLYGFGADYATEIDEDALLAAQSACDESVAILGPSTEKRYTANGVLDTANDPLKNLEILLSAMDGKAVYSGGAWKLSAGVYHVPTLTLNEDDFIGPLQIQASTPRSELFNAVKGLYIEPSNLWQPTDFPAQVSSTYANEDGETLFRDIELRMTHTHTAAQRIARIHLLKARQQIKLNATCRLSALPLSPPDTVMIDNTRMGWSAKVFDVLAWQFTFAADKLAVALTLGETDSSVYDWNTGLEQSVDPAPNTNLPNPFDIDPITNLSATSGDAALLLEDDGTVVSRILVSWGFADVNRYHGFEIQWVNLSAADYQWHQATTRAYSYYIAPAKDGDDYSIRVRAFNHFGVKGAWNTISTYTVAGKSAKPPDVGYFLVQRQADGTREFTWTYDDPPKDLAGFKIRYSLGTGGTWGSMQALHTGLLSASPFETNLLAAGTYTVGIKAVDTSGNESANAALIESTLGDPRLKNVILSLDLRALKWPGTKTGCGYDAVSMALNPASNDEWGDYSGGDWDDMDQWNDDPVTEMVYDHTTIDLGVVVAFKPLVSVAIAGGAVTIEESHSDDDTTYSSYAEVGPQIIARYLKLRITVDNPDLLGITQGTLNLDAESIYEVIEDLDTSTVSSPAGDFRLPLTKSYIKIFNANLALQNVGAGWSWEVIDKDPINGPRIKIYNASDTLADATIDAEIKGV